MIVNIIGNDCWYIKWLSISEYKVMIVIMNND